MNKILFYLFWTTLCLHTTITFAEAASDDIEASLANIDAIIAQTQSETLTNTEEELILDAAPAPMLYNTTVQTTNTPIQYTAWELIHRTFLMQGFTLGGDMGKYVTPAMYIGTPLATNQSPLGYDTEMGATNYFECVRIETDASFGENGALIEETAEAELKNIAKYCATEFYGSYFEGKSYTTREEVLMLLFTMFDEDVALPGYFDGTSFVFDGEETDVPFENVSSRAWYAPYVSRAYAYLMTEDESTWKIAAEITDEDISMMLDMYMLDAAGDALATITTEYGTYTIVHDEMGLTIEKNTVTPALNAAPSESEELSDEELLAEIFAE